MDPAASALTSLGNCCGPCVTGHWWSQDQGQCPHETPSLCTPEPARIAARPSKKQPWLKGILVGPCHPMQGSPESSDSTSFPGHSQGDTAGHTDSKSYIRVIQAGPKASEDAELPE